MGEHPAVEGAAAKGRALKRQAGRDLIIFGSADLCSSLMQAGLIDEFRVMVNPVALGTGRPLSRGVKDKLELALLNPGVFRSGNVLLVYRPRRR